MSNTATTPRPTDEQVATVVSAIKAWPEADLVAWMEEAWTGEAPGTMLLSLSEDGLEQIARFGTDGVIIGDWF